MCHVSRFPTQAPSKHRTAAAPRPQFIMSFANDCIDLIGYCSITAAIATAAHTGFMFAKRPHVPTFVKFFTTELPAMLKLVLKK